MQPRPLRFFGLNALVLALTVGLLPAASWATADPLPRIKIRTTPTVAEFYDAVTGETFYPEGNNLVRKHTAEGKTFHSTFLVGLYDPLDMETALAGMAASGYNVVRVFVTGGGRELSQVGIWGTGGDVYQVTGPELYAPAMDNFLDFLTRANAHGIYVYPVLHHWPYNAYYQDLMTIGGDPNIERVNRRYLVEGSIQAKETYGREFVQYIKDHAPELLSTVFAYQLDNEVFCTTAQKPFSMDSGTITTADGQTYDMAIAEDRQAAQDENMNLWASRSADAIRGVDPAALVTTSVFSYMAVSPSGPSGLFPIVTNDQRWPARLTKLAQSSLSFLDLHSYPGFNPIEPILDSVEFDTIDRTVVPLVLGEFGARKSLFTAAEAPQVVLDWRNEFYMHEFAGSFLWGWDTDDLGSHSATVVPAIDAALSPNARVFDWGFDTAGDFEGWTTNQAVGSPTVARGRLGFDLAGANPQLLSPAGLGLAAAHHQTLTLRILNPTSATTARLSWSLDDSGLGEGMAGTVFPIDANGSEIEEVSVFLGNHPDWHGIVDQVRLDPVDVLGSWSFEPGPIEIDSIRLSGQVATFPHVATVLDEQGDLSEMFIDRDATLDYRDLGNPSQLWGGGWADFNTLPSSPRIKPLGFGDVDENGVDDSVVLTVSGYVYAILNTADGIDARRNLGQPAVDFGGDFASFFPGNTDVLPLGVGDVDGDGHDDVVVRTADGSVQVLWTDGTTLTGTANLGQPCQLWGGVWCNFRASGGGDPGFDPDYWQVVGVGDVDGVGYDDVVLIDPAGGLFALSIDGLALTGATSLGNPGATWGGGWLLFSAQSNVLKSLAVTDVDHDGYHDIVVLSASGYVIVLWSDGASVVATPNTVLGQPIVDWAGWPLKPAWTSMMPLDLGFGGWWPW